MSAILQLGLLSMFAGGVVLIVFGDLERRRHPQFLHERPGAGMIGTGITLTCLAAAIALLWIVSEIFGGLATV